MARTMYYFILCVASFLLLASAKTRKNQINANPGKDKDPESGKRKASVTVPTCKVAIDLGFLVDAAASMKDSFQDEKEFVKAVAGAFDVSKDGTHLSAMAFSGRVEHSIKFTNDLKRFSDSVDAIPLIGSSKLVSRGMRAAYRSMFTSEAGARTNVEKILILLTDGGGVSGNKWNKILGNKIRQKKIKLFAVGMGSLVPRSDLTDIAQDNAFAVDNIKKLVGVEFLKKFIEKLCPESNVKENEQEASKTEDEEIGNDLDKELYPPEKPMTKNFDIGILMDSSKNIKEHFQESKTAVKAIATLFNLTQEGSHASLMRFGHTVDYSIKLKDFVDLNTFNSAVDALQMFSTTTRMTRSMQSARSQMFKPSFGARELSPKLFIVMFGGNRAPQERKAYRDPVEIASEMRREGISVFVIVTSTSPTNVEELKQIAGGEDKFFNLITLKDNLKVFKERAIAEMEKNSKKKKAHIFVCGNPSPPSSYSPLTTADARNYRRELDALIEKEDLTDPNTNPDTSTEDNDEGDDYGPLQKDGKDIYVFIKKIEDRCLQPAPGASGGAEARGAKGTRWYYDKSINGCKSFTASGENDQENNYRTEEECDKICAPHKTDPTTNKSLRVCTE